ncbi:glycosyltransferase [Rubripirellula reticaptiva]|uniref:D-inositol-3-phosphate glycosyltransferase n=1 Tax=Rubripirellula reticaptiva TaxID=2528013 RepID=A0A5C6F945_9BACT|nr:glycosyltransferase [Rubripirellula reticaptiva]TWU57895.1 D-inositol-3-phosphate glycosyltransferase [Rubripirellula reticaptiva]
MLARKRVGIVEGPNVSRMGCLSRMDIDGFELQPLRTIPVHRLGNEDRFWSFSQLSADSNYDLVHATNTIPLNAKRFVVSFHDDPARRHVTGKPWQERLGTRILSSPSCRAITTQSEIAKRQLVDRYLSIGMTEAAKKVIVYRGEVGDSYSVPRAAFAAVDARASQSEFEGPLRLIFIAEDALGMGLLPTLDACESLRAVGTDIRLTIVSTLACGVDTVLGRFAPSRESLHNRIRSANWVKHWAPPSRRRVRQLIARNDLIVMPALDNVFGWQLVDAGMEGCPAITTNVFSLPEIVENEQTGLVISLPKNKSECWVGSTLSDSVKRDAIIDANHILRDQLTILIARLNFDRGRLRELGMAAQAKMQLMFGQAAAAEQLRQVYCNACC